MAMIGRKPPSAFERFLLGSDEINAREEAARKQEALMALQNALRPTQRVTRGMMGPGADGAPMGQVIPQDQRRVQMPGLREASPALIEAALAGLNVDPITGILDKTQPDIATERGWSYDRKDPNNANRFFEEAPAKGTRPVFDQDGKPVGWMNSQGTLQSLADQARATETGTQAGRAPYDFIDVPDPSGAPRKISKAQAMGGDFVGQSPADAIRENAIATGEGERAQALQSRAASASRQLQVLDKMESLLPDVVAGFGADAKLQGYRALAATGNEAATRKVAATETFLNQGRVLVADIIKTFGANPTEGERKYAERMSGADAQLNPETLREGIKLQRERINRDLEAAGQGGGGRGPSRGLSTSMFPRSAIEAEMRRRGLLQ